jgi:hypothetical protein
MQKILFWLDQHAEVVVIVLSAIALLVLAWFYMGLTLGDLLTLLDMISQA